MTAASPCVTYSNVFLHPFMEDGAIPSSRGDRREQQMLRNQAEKMCAECPLMEKCLSDAVLRFDVNGYVAGTTKRQRAEIRARLGVKVAPEDFDVIAGVINNRQINPAEILRLRQAHPDQPLSSIAAKIGCSVSTIKRHLRKLEEEGDPNAKRGPLPSTAEVMAVAARVKEGRRTAAA